MYFVSITACYMLDCFHYNYSKLCTGHLLLCSFNENISISYCAAISCDYYHLSTIQNGVTALQQASNEGRQKVVELLLVAGANPDLQNKVRTEWHSA